MIASVHSLPLVLGMALPVASLGHYFFGILMSITAVFLILLVLVQRGRGGGLAGAFGGMGGQSAFGTKAGDTFTRVTIGVAIFWIIVCVSAIKFLSAKTGAFGRPGDFSETELDRPVRGTGLPADESQGSGATDGPSKGSATTTPAPSGSGSPPSGEAPAGPNPSANDGAPANPAPAAATPPTTENPATTSEAKP